MNIKTIHAHSHIHIIDIHAHYKCTCINSHFTCMPSTCSTDRLNDKSLFCLPSLRLYLRGYSGTAGRQSSLTTHGTGFSTRDQDNDNCDHCKCALMLTGGDLYSFPGKTNTLSSKISYSHVISQGGTTKLITL